MMLVDSHCHLDGNEFDTDREAVIDRALAEGVNRMLTIGTGEGPPDLEAAIRLAERYEPVWATVGVHPHHAGRASAETWAALTDLAAHPKVVAVGEIGLDYHYDFAPRGTQHAVFQRQLELAREAGKPVVIHTREAWDDTLRILEEIWTPAGIPGIMHCFSEGPAEAGEAVDLGFYLGFTGMVTFPKAAAIQQAAAAAPLERILVETDAPYLAPVPKRGKRNEPAFVRYVAQHIATLRQMPLEDLARATTANFDRICFGASEPAGERG